MTILLVWMTSCYFGANESGERIIRDFYLIGWDEKDWQIVYSEDNNYHDERKIIIRHDVFAVGHNDNFIIVKQHPCSNSERHLVDYDSHRPNKEVTNYYIIDIRKNVNPYALHKFPNEKTFEEGRRLLGVEDDLTYKFYDSKLE